MILDFKPDMSIARRKNGVMFPIALLCYRTTLNLHSSKPM